MINLKEYSGLEVSLGDDGKLSFAAEVVYEKFSTRYHSDLKEVLKDGWSGEDRDLYYMYRNVRHPQDEKLMRENNLRYDLTVILPGLLGNEFAKTLGHYHPDKIKGVSYPEVYEVLHGEAIYLIQEPEVVDGIIDYSKIKSAYTIKVKAGEKAIMPPNFGHVTINAGEEALVMANWVSDSFSSDYTEYERQKGGAYYGVSEAGKIRFEANPKYLETAELITASPVDLPDFALVFNKPMYHTGVEAALKLKYLDNPEVFLEQLQPEKVYSHIDRL